MTTQLVKYDAARHALAEALRVDEVKPIRDLAVAAQHYARQAKDTQMIENATDIRFRAEAKLGQILTTQAKDGTRHSGHGDQKSGSRPATPKLSDLGFTKTQSSKFQRLGALPSGKFEAVVEKAVARAVNATTSAACGRVHSGNIEWYIPPEYFPMAIEVMGGIDLCPASCKLAQDKSLPGVPYFTKEDDGLTKPWRGKIWLNPPYATGLIEPFVHKLVEEHKAGHVTQAIMIVNNATETSWFHEAVEACSAFCFVRGRVKFWRPPIEGKDDLGPTRGQCLIYFGQKPKKFAKVFSKLGFVR